MLFLDYLSWDRNFYRYSTMESDVIKVHENLKFEVLKLDFGDLVSDGDSDRWKQLFLD